MPDLGHLEKLTQGAVAWNAWRTRDPSVIPDLTAAAPTLSQRQMGFSNGGPINLRYALLQDADFRFATLTAADLEGANLSRANLTDARLDGANLTAADLSEASLDKVDFNEAVLERTNLARASLRGARHLTQAQLWQAIGDASTALPDDLTRPSHWLARSSSAEFEECQPEGPYIASPDRDQQETKIPGSCAAPKIAVEENLLSLNGPRAGSRSHLATAIGLSLFLAVLGFVWYVTIAPLDERSASRIAPSPPPVELKSTGVTVAPQSATESEKSVDALEGRNAPSLRQDVQPPELSPPAPDLLGTPSAPSTTVPLPTTDKPSIEAREVPQIMQPVPLTNARSARVGQSEPPPSNRESGPPPSDDVPKPKRRKPAELNSRDAASDILTGGLQ